MKRRVIAAVSAALLGAGGAAAQDAGDQSLTYEAPLSCSLALVGGPSVDVSLDGSGLNAFNITVDCNTEFDLSSSSTQLVNTRPIQFNNAVFTDRIEISTVEIDTAAGGLEETQSGSGAFVAQRGGAPIEFFATVANGRRLVAGSYVGLLNVTLTPAF
ncbi:MAG: hypothetical protein AAFR16_03575 [Pseudomonadota bacterium]